MEKQEIGKYEMTLKRALKIALMNREYFKSNETADVRDKAIEFLQKHPNYQIIKKGKVPTSGVEIRTQIEKEAERLFNEDLKENPYWRQCLEDVEREETTHEIDRLIKDLVDSYIRQTGDKSWRLPSIIIDEANSNLTRGHNCFEKKVWDYDENSHNTTLKPLTDKYKLFIEVAIRKMKELIQKNEGKKHIDIDETKKIITMFEKALEKIIDLENKAQIVTNVKESKMNVVVYETITKPNERYEKSLDEIMIELGLNPENEDARKTIQTTIEVTAGAKKVDRAIIKAKKIPNYGYVKHTADQISQDDTER